MAEAKPGVQSREPGRSGAGEVVCRAGRTLDAGSGILAGPWEMNRIHTGGTGQARTAQAWEKV